MTTESSTNSASSDKESWFAAEFRIPNTIADLFFEVLGSLESDGVEIDSLRKKADEIVTARAYFQTKPDEKLVFESVHQAMSHFGLDPRLIAETSITEIVQQDWLAEWKKHWTPTTVGRFVVAPSWFDIDESEKLVIRIEPSMAFGTGTHETTKLCLQFIDEEFGDSSFLDVGTGTGVLAIAAAMVSRAESRARFFGCDTDVDSITIAKENAAANGVSWIEFAVGSLETAEDSYDFVCANMTIDILRPLVNDLISRTNRMIVFSGILVEQEAEFLNLLPTRYRENARIERLGEWVAVGVAVDR